MKSQRARKPRTAAVSMAALLARAAPARAGLALVYHEVGEGSHDGRERLVPAVSASNFDDHLRHLKRFYSVVPVDRLQDEVRARRRWQRFPVAITFDDDLRSHAEIAAPLLRRHGLTATFYLCGASLEAPFSFWWERLQRAHDRGALAEVAPGLAAACRPLTEVAASIERLDVASRGRIALTLLRAEGADPEGAGLRAPAISDVVNAGQRVGFHTRDHDALPSLGDAALDRALRAGRPELEALTGTALTSIAYPHGKADTRVAAAAQRAGFVTGFTTTAEPVRLDDDPLLLGRLDPSSDPLSRFGWRLPMALLGLRPKATVRGVLRSIVPKAIRPYVPARMATIQPTVGKVRLGTLRRPTPISTTFGFDRGTPVDRYYIEAVIRRYGRVGGDIRGRVLEVGDDRYARDEMSRVERLDILDVNPANERATVIADLADAGHLEGGRFDCIICTQTLLLIYDVHAAIRELHRLLAPGGVLLLTVPGISQICATETDTFDDFWRFTTASVTRLLDEAFPPQNVIVEAYGNVLAASAFLYGLAAEELTAAELDRRDPRYEVVIGARAVKAGAPPAAGDDEARR